MSARSIKHHLNVKVLRRLFRTLKSQDVNTTDIDNEELIFPCTVLAGYCDSLENFNPEILCHSIQ